MVLVVGLWWVVCGFGYKLVVVRWLVGWLVVGPLVGRLVGGCPGELRTTSNAAAAGDLCIFGNDFAMILAMILR